jgi:hypothetical protein
MKGRNGSYGVVSSRWHLEKEKAGDHAYDKSGETKLIALPFAGVTYSYVI